VSASLFSRKMIFSAKTFSNLRPHKQNWDVAFYFTPGAGDYFIKNKLFNHNILVVQPNNEN
jgi:hypothetical protein